MCLFSVVFVFMHSNQAEREGFEPPDPCRSTVFKTAAIDRSAISPGAKLHIFQRLPNLRMAFNFRNGTILSAKMAHSPISLVFSTPPPYLCTLYIYLNF